MVQDDPSSAGQDVTIPWIDHDIHSSLPYGGVMDVRATPAVSSATHYYGKGHAAPSIAVVQLPGKRF